MNVPLSINTYYGDKDSRQELKLWLNGKRTIQKAPFLPYFYSSVKPIFPCIKNVVTRRLLTNPYKEKNLYKCEFNTTGDVSKYSNDETDYENHIPFVQRLMMDDTEWVSNFANTDPLKLIIFDIEVENDGTRFPVADKDAVAGIGYKVVTGMQNLGGNIDSDEIITSWSEHGGNDYKIIQDFMNVLRDYDPDIIVGFNSNKFDLQYLRDRCAINGINFKNYIARDTNVSHPVNFIEKENVATRKKYIELRIEGRVSYDLYFPVMRDQSIYGIKARNMKTVAEWYNIKDIVKEDMSNINRYLSTDNGKKRLDKYLRSDINITEQLFKIYMPNSIMLAEKLFIPLDEIVNSSPSLMSNIIFGRELSKRNIISDGTVMDRFNKSHVADKEGALVDTFRYGYIKKIKKLDFKSYYPFLTVQFNLSPETTFITGYEEIGGYKFGWKEEKGIKWFIASIPDKKINKNILVRIDQTNKGFLPIYMRELFAERATLKSKMKEIEKDIGKDKVASDYEYAGLKSRETAIKIIINSFTGYAGNQFALYGSLAVYCCITGFGRYITGSVIDNYKSQIVSSDTDGIFYERIRR